MATSSAPSGDTHSVRTLERSSCGSVEAADLTRSTCGSPGQRGCGKTEGHVTSYHVISRHVTSYRITSAPTGENRPPRHERQKAFRPRNAWPTMTHLRHSVADRGQQGVVKHAHGTAPVRRADEILERKVDRHSVLKLCVGRGSRLAVWPNGQLHSGLITRKAAKSDDANTSFHHIPSPSITFQHIPTPSNPSPPPAHS